MIDRFPDDSMLAAVIHGGEDWQQRFGWGVDRSIAASIFDINTVTARAAGNWKKPPNFDMWPRPWQQQAKKTEQAPASLDNIFSFFASGGGKKGGSS
jgi:hypothetical protein